MQDFVKNSHTNKESYVQKGTLMLMSLMYDKAIMHIVFYYLLFYMQIYKYK